MDSGNTQNPAAVLSGPNTEIVTNRCKSAGVLALPLSDAVYRVGSDVTAK